MSEIKYLDTEALKYFNNKQKIFYDNRYILKNNVTLEEYNSTSDIQFVLTTDQIDGTSNIKGVDLLTHSVPMAKKADYAETAKNATTASYAESADNAATSDFASVAGSANNLTNSVKIYGQDFNGSAAVDGALNISNTKQVSLSGNLYGCNTPFSISSTIGHVGAKMTINNNGYGSYTNGTTLYLWHQTSDGTNATSKQLYSITSNSEGYVVNWGFQKLNATGTAATYKSLTSSAINATGNLKIGPNSEVDMYYIDGKLVINKQLTNPSITDHETRITALENGSTGGSTETWVGTQTQYDAITIKDADTFYYITED